MHKCDYVYKPKNDPDVEYGCTFCARDDEIKTYQTTKGNFCRFHLPVEEKYRVLEEQGDAPELQGLKKEVEDMIARGESCYGLQMHEEINISDTKVEGMYFDDSIFAKDVVIQNTELAGLDFSFCHFKGSLELNRSKVTGLRIVVVK